MNPNRNEEAFDHALFNTAESHRKEQHRLESAPKSKQKRRKDRKKLNLLSEQDKMKLEEKWKV